MIKNLSPLDKRRRLIIINMLACIAVILAMLLPGIIIYGYYSGLLAVFSTGDTLASYSVGNTLGIKIVGDATVVVPVIPPPENNTSLPSDISDAKYKGTITTINTSSAATSVTVPFTLSTTSLISSGYVNSTLTNTAMRYGTSDIAYMPEPSGSSWWIFLPTVVTGSSTQTLYTGGTKAMNGKMRYLPATTGMTTADFSGSDLGDNFAIDLKGYFDTAAGTNKFIMDKRGATGGLDIWNSGAGLIQADIWGAATSGGSATSVGDLALYSGGSIRAGQKVTAFSGQIYSVTAYLKNQTGNATGNLSVKVRKQSDDSVLGTVGTLDVSTLTTSFVSHTFSNAVSVNAATDIYVLVEYSGGNVTDNIGVGFDSGTDGVHYDTTYHDDATTDYLEYSYYPILKTISAAVTSGEHLIRVYADGTNFGIYVDGSLKTVTALGGVSVTDNSSDYVSFLNGSMPYVEYQKIYVNGTLVQDIECDTSIGAQETTFSDQSGNSHTAVPDFPAASSDPDVSATLTSFLPITEAKLGTGTGGVSTGGILTTDPTMPSQMYTELNFNNVPGA